MKKEIAEKPLTRYVIARSIATKQSLIRLKRLLPATLRSRLRLGIARNDTDKYLPAFPEIICFIMIVFLFFGFPSVGFSLSQFTTEEDSISARLGQHFGLSGSSDVASLNPAEWFKGNGPKDIYLLMYNQAKTKPQSKATLRTLEQVNFTEKEKEELLKGNNVTLFAGPLVMNVLGGSTPESDKYVMKGLGIQSIQQLELREKMEALQESFEIEAQVADLESSLEGEAVATEIFADGDTGNSGFDLLVDLDTISLILFGEPTTLFGTSGAGNLPGSFVLPVPGRAGKEAEKAKEEKKKKDRGGKTSSSLEENSDAASGSSTGTGEFSSEQCRADSGLESALDRYNSTQDNGDKGEGDDGKLGTKKSAQTGGSGTSGQLGADRPPLTPAPAQDWGRQLPCNETFCITVEAIKKTESAKPADINCITCHIEKINDLFNKTLRRNLTPSKATGNLFELPKCKSGWNFTDLLHLNVYFLPNPILTPPNDDIVTENVFLKGYDEFCKKYSPIFSKQICPTATESDKVPLETVEQATKRALAASTEESTFSSIDTEVAAFLNQQRTAAVQDLEKFRTLSRAKNYSTTFDAVQGEIETMKSYFEAFQRLFGAFHQPCETLRNLPVCS